MFQYCYPKFQFKAILRQEMLEQLRDYPKNFIKLSYMGYQEGIVSGCHISWDNQRITVGAGMVFHGGHIYFMETPFTVECMANHQKQYLKIQFASVQEEVTEVVANARILLSNEVVDQACEMELCRFYLQEGARLRDTYESFEDMSTEFDTIHLMYAPYTREDGITLNPKILMQYAKETMKNKSGNLYDIAFAMNVLTNSGHVSMECVLCYLEVQLDETMGDQSLSNMYQGLLKVLREQGRTGIPQKNEMGGMKTVQLW